ncbi:hypothetical protein Tharo_0715 [Thauera aromatica K172]|uniref:Uncharacterized protein n=1 Tax=Thauera aromatica K172 TaxID=44139 RepID=A0A2R4BJZ9_THAAR|nr:hypothetical protein Tharo_0715 [Thauera aromatica K172]
MVTKVSLLLGGQVTDDNFNPNENRISLFIQVAPGVEVVLVDDGSSGEPFRAEDEIYGLQQR